MQTCETKQNYSPSMADIKTFLQSQRTSFWQHITTFVVLYHIGIGYFKFSSTLRLVEEF
jgi:hypothetical protein